MCRKVQTYQSSVGQDQDRLSLDKSIGDLFRAHGEDYIKIYKPAYHKIKLIRAIRLCKSPALGGKRITCKRCQSSQVIYLSCGHSQCPLCQNHKRNLWQVNLASKLFAVPYVHTVFTVPHELNALMRQNEKVLYNITMRSAWKTIKAVSKESINLGGLPGMVAVLHTFGSDMKYHVHVHALITFGGIDKQGNWKWPKRKNKLAPFRYMSKKYRDVFLEMLSKALRSEALETRKNIGEIIEVISNKRWNVRNGRPTTDTGILERYLARYINRIAISRSRLEYVKDKEKSNSIVNIIYKDYRNQVQGKPAPIAFKSMPALVAIHKFMMHCLPPYFQKTRYYGLHASSTYKKISHNIPLKFRRHKDTISNLFAILKDMMKQVSYSCKKCGNESFEVQSVKADTTWIYYFITVPSYRAPPSKSQNNKDAIMEIKY